jgi:predicted RNase H-like HicB family nuclease
MRYYPAVFEPCADGFSVWFPDLPGCTSAGSSLADAMRNAEEGLQFHIEGMTEDGEEIPAPSALDARLPEWTGNEATPGSVRLLVRAEVESDSRAVRVNITVPEDLLAKIDRYASQHGYTRSGLLVATVRERIKRD